MKNVVEDEGDGDTNYNWHTWNGFKKFGKAQEELVCFLYFKGISTFVGYLMLKPSF